MSCKSNSQRGDTGPLPLLLLFLLGVLLLGIYPEQKRHGGILNYLRSKFGVGEKSTSRIPVRKRPKSLAKKGALDENANRVLPSSNTAPSARASTSTGIGVVDGARGDVDGIAQADRRALDRLINGL